MDETKICRLQWKRYNNFQMEGAVSCGQLKPEGTCKIFFSQKVFGKPTKNRKEDPTMFQLLTWGSEGFERHAFKKDERIREPTEAYMNMIGKNPWTSEAQESYVNYHDNCLEANPDVLGKIQNYISERRPQSPLPQKKSPQKGKRHDKKMDAIDQRKENKYNPAKYLSPKATGKAGVGTIQTHKNIRSSSGDHKRLEGEDKRGDKYEQEHKKMLNKTYGQNLQKTKLEEHEFSEHQQQKLIEKFKQTTRWIPNSAFTTYFGKPPFENYGRGNTHPVDGGLVYGTYLYSHNVHPHRGKNQPKNMQSYPVALSKAKSQGTLIPSCPRTKAEFSGNFDKTKCNQKIEPEMNNFVGSLGIQAPRLEEMEKFGGKRRSRVTTEQQCY